MTAQHTETASFTFLFDELPTLKLVAHGADVVVHHDAPELSAEVVVHADEGIDVAAIDSTSDNDRATITIPPLLAPAGRQRGFSFQVGRHSISLGHTVGIQVEAHVPPGAHLDVDTRSGDVSVTGTTGRAAIRTGSGDIHLEDAAEVMAETGSGDLGVGLCGGGRLKTGSGDVALGTLRGDLAIMVGSGDVDVRHAEGHLALHSGSGDLVVHELGAGAVVAKTGSADVSIGIVPGVPVWQEVLTITGDMQVDLTPRGEPADGQAHVEVRVTTASGDVRLHDA